MKKNQGVILLLAVSAAAILSLLGAIFYVSSFVNQRLAERQMLMAQAVQNAEAGIERALFYLNQEFSPTAASPDWTINGVAFIPSNNFAVFPIPAAETQLNGGLIAVEQRRNPQRNMDIWIRSTGTVGGVSQSIMAYVSIRNMSMWNAAIFAVTGEGPGHGFINGNSEIHGSVHILGDGLAQGQNALELKGTAYLSNNYTSKTNNSPTFLAPGILPSIINEANLATLSAELRVKNGGVTLGGTSAVGEPNVTGNGWKETFDGTFVTDGFDNTSSVHSDNGWENGYDLGDLLTRPTLNSPHKGAPNYETYYLNNAVVLPVKNGKFELIKDIPLAVQTRTTAQGTSSIEMDAKGNLKITGIVYVPGDLVIRCNCGGVGAISYEGSGTIFVAGKVTVEASFKAKRVFAEDNLVAIMSKGDMLLGPLPHAEIMGLFYSERNINIRRQTNIAGTVAAATFDMDQVPGIYQVPATLDHLPPDIVGAEPVWVVRVVSWQKD